jgi:Calpain family cysteine protease
MAKNDDVKASAEHIGVANPFALAEVMTGKRIKWQGVAEPTQLLEQALGRPYDELFDPKFDSPLYPGLKLHSDTMRVEPSEMPELGVGALAAPSVGASTVWVDPGDFFEFGAELNDPVQGSSPDCYYIAALSSVAWALTFQIAQRARRTDQVGHFKDMIELYVSGAWKKYEVSEELPLLSPGNTFIYARSSEIGEIWPAVYEKAYAQYRGNSSLDHPDYGPLAYGDPVAACVHLTGWTGHYYSNGSMSAHDIWQAVRSNSISYKTFNPMVAWTFGTAPAGVNYSTSHIVANHAYSIIGWTYMNNLEYVVLRNPWGTYEGTLNVAGGSWTAWDAPYYGGSGWWHPLSLPTVDGVFALRADTFKSHFAGFGLVKK